MLQACAMVNDVAQHFGCSRQTIHNLNTRFAITGSASWSTSCDVTTGRPLYYTDAFLPATATARQLGVNAQTIRNCLRNNNIPIRPRRPYSGPILTASHWTARLFWAQRHLHWTRRQWHNVIFSAESWFSVSHADGRVRVYRRRNERYSQCCVKERDRFGAGVLWYGEVSWAKSRQILSWIITSFHSCRILDLA